MSKRLELVGGIIIIDCVCVFFPFILDVKFVGCTNRGHRQPLYIKSQSTAVQQFNSISCWSERFDNRFICVGVDFSIYALLTGERSSYSPV